MTSDSMYSVLMMQSSNNITQKTNLSLLDTMHFLTLLLKNSKVFILELNNQLFKLTLKALLVMKAKLTKSIGQQKEQYLELKIKDNADHAGHFQLSGLSKVFTQLKMEKSKLSLNKLQLIALKMEIKDVMEDGWIMRLIGLKPMVFHQKILTNIPLEMEHAKNSHQFSKMQDLLMYLSIHQLK